MNNTTTLVITTCPIPSHIAESINVQSNGGPIVVLSLARNSLPCTYPVSWRQLSLDELPDEALFREQFLNFIERWPQQPLINGKSFNDLFRDSDGRYLWWTGESPGLNRHPYDPIVLTLKDLWRVSCAVEIAEPNEIVAFSHDESLNALLSNKFAGRNSEVHLKFAEGSAKPQSSPWRGRTKFLFDGFRRLASTTWKIVRRLIRSPFASKRKNDGDLSRQPSIVMTAHFPRHVSMRDERADVWYWEGLCREIQKLSPKPEIKFLFQELGCSEADPDITLEMVDDQIKVPPAAPVPLRRWLAVALRLFVNLCRYASMESRPNFRESMHFCETDIAPLLLPQLRNCLIRGAAWEYDVACIESSLRQIEDLRAALIHVEMFRPGMIVTAACQRLGVPTVGVQHGTIHEWDPIYLIPQSQIQFGAIPDFNAAYGQYAASVLCEYGEYPRDRVWICGAPRFDYLVKKPQDQAACRDVMGLPRDKTVLLFTTPGNAWFSDAVRDAIETVSKMSDVCVCVKAWMFEDQKELTKYCDLISEYKNVDIRLFQDQFETLLGACDALVGRTSTTVLEATLLGKPTVSVDYSEEVRPNPYADHGVSIRAANRFELQAAIKELLSFELSEAWERRRRQFLKDHVGPTLDGKAAEVFAANIDEKLLCGTLASRPETGVCDAA